MGVALFTSRIVLQTLGVTDYGVNNVVAGVVSMFGFLSNTLMVITQRFITVELGKGGELSNLQRIFSSSMILHIAVGIFIFIIAETIGLWFLNNKLVIPAERMIAANWVFQFAVFGFLLSLFNAPHMALIISHEDMHIYGYMGIFDVAMRLLTVYILLIINSDKLIFYSFFTFFVSLIVSLFYILYCRRKYPESHFTICFDKSMIKELSGFGGYVFIASIFLVLSNHGINIMLNLFFGPVLNAARGIAVSVNSAIVSFSNSFKQALNPQLMKSYAQNNPEYMWSLSERGTRIMYFLFLFLSAPILLETDFILNIWLTIVPEYTSIFTKLIIINALINTLLHTIAAINNATGNIRNYYCIGYITSILTLLLSYLLCKAGYKPQYVFVVPLLLFPLCMTTLCMVMKKQMNFSIKYFARKALFPILLVTLISFFPFIIVNNFYDKSFYYSLLIICISLLWTGIIIVFVGLNKNEREKLIILIKRKIGFAI